MAEVIAGHDPPGLGGVAQVDDGQAQLVVGVHELIVADPGTVELQGEKEELILHLISSHFIHVKKFSRVSVLF